MEKKRCFPSRISENFLLAENYLEYFLVSENVLNKKKENIKKNFLNIIFFLKFFLNIFLFQIKLVFGNLL